VWQKRRRHQRHQRHRRQDPLRTFRRRRYCTCWRRFAGGAVYWPIAACIGRLSEPHLQRVAAQLIESGLTPGAGHRSADHQCAFLTHAERLLQTLGRRRRSGFQFRRRVDIRLGAFAFVSVWRAARWGLMPVIAMLATGWVLHIGPVRLLSTLGLCFLVPWRRHGNRSPARGCRGARSDTRVRGPTGLPVAWPWPCWRTSGWAAPCRPRGTAPSPMAGSLAAVVAARAVVTA